MDDEKTLTLPQVARLCGLQVETLRMWYRRGYLDSDGGGKWRRYDLKGAASTIFYATVVRRTKDHEIAKEALELLHGLIAERLDGFVEDELWAFFFRSKDPKSSAQKAVVAMRKEIGGAAPELFLHCEVTSTAEQTEMLAREMLVSADYGDGTLTPTIIPVHAIWLRTAVDLAEFLEIEKKVSK